MPQSVWTSAVVLNGRVTKELLDGLQVAGPVENTLARRVTRLVRTPAPGRTSRRDTGARQAPVPPVVEPCTPIG